LNKLLVHFDKSILPSDQQGDWQEKLSNDLLFPVRAIHGQTIIVDHHPDLPYKSDWEKIRHVSRNRLLAVAFTIAAPVTVPSLLTGAVCRWCSSSYDVTYCAWLQSMEPLLQMSEYQPPELI
jgi:hypothetical protein